MKELLHYIVKHLVDKPDEISIEEIDRDGATILQLRVAQEDLGKVIGRGGRMAKDLRLLARVAAPDGQKVMVDIIG